MISKSVIRARKGRAGDFQPNIAEPNLGPRTAVFDLDGTLVDTSGDLIAAANACFRDAGEIEPLRSEEDKAIAFRGARALLRTGHERLGLCSSIDAFLGERIPAFLEFYEHVLDDTSYIYPGARQALRDMAADDWCLAICTNKPYQLAVTLLDRLDLLGHFAAVVGADSLAHAKPHPAPYRHAVNLAGGSVEQSFLVGDTEIDRDTAQRAQVPFVLVGFRPEGHNIDGFGTASLP